MMVHATTLALLVQGRGTSFAGSGTALYDSFTTYNGSVWSYADGAMGTTDGCRVWCVFGAISWASLPQQTTLITKSELA